MIGAVVPVSVPGKGARCDYRIKLPRDPSFEGWRCTASVGPDGRHDGDHGYSIVAEEEWERAAAPAPGAYVHHVAGATPSGDNCRECGRQLNVEEPACRAPGGDGWRCAKCEIADVHTPTGDRRAVREPGGRVLSRVDDTPPRCEAPTLKPIGNIDSLRTSDVMCLAAAHLEQRGDTVVAADLRRRAGLLGGLSADVAGDPKVYTYLAAILRAIGEVRS